MKKTFTICALIFGVALAYAATNSYQETIQKARVAYEANKLQDAQKLTEESLLLAQTPIEKSAALLRLGKLAKENNRPIEARKSWEQIVALSGAPAQDKALAQYAIGGSYLDEDNYVAAREALQPLLQGENVPMEQRVAARMGIALSYLNEKAFPEARTAFGQVIADKNAPSPFRATAQQQIGEAFFSQQKWPEAIAAFHAVGDIQGVSPTLIASAQKRANDAYIQQGDVATATSETEKMGFRFLKKADEIANSDRKDLVLIRDNLSAALILSEPNSFINIYIREKIAESYVISKDYAKARTELEAISAIATPDGATDSQQHSFDILRQKAQQNLALSYQMEGQIERARQEYQKVLQMPNLDPKLKSLVQKQLDDLK